MGIRSKIVLFLKGSMILTISNICTKAINFFLLPLYTKYLTPEQLGISDSITTLSSLVLPLLVLGLDSAFSAFYFDKKTEEYKNCVFSNITFTLLLTSIIPIILILFAKPISVVVLGNQSYWYIMSISLLSLSCQLWYLPYSLYLRVENRMTAFGIITTTASCLMIVSNIITVYKLQIGAAALIVSTLITNIVMLFMYMIAVRKMPHKKYVNSKLNKSILRYSLPLVPMGISTWVLTASDRMILLELLGEGAVGIYGIAARFVTVVNVFTNSVYMAYTTFVFSVKDEEHSQQVYAMILNIFYYTLVVIVFCVSLFSKEILQVMVDEQYMNAYRLMAPLLFAQVLYAAITIIGYGIALKKRSEFMLLSVSVAAVINVALNLLFITKWGVFAAAMTTWIGYFIMLILVNHFSQKLYPCPYETAKLLLSSTVLTVISILGAIHLSLVLKFALFIIAITGLTVLYYKDVKRVVFQLMKLLRR
ncbi:MAG: oligosaccharide flippase family protein [Firmicutes bacterium]|nr:oligosaccharide flippase family protein [Bacillota bacterium]